MTTNFLMFCMASSDGLDLALGAGVVGFEFAAGKCTLAVGYRWLRQWQWGSVSRELVEG